MKVFEEISCLDPTMSMQEDLAEDGFSQTILPDCNTSFPMDDQHSYPSQQAAVPMEREINQQLNLETEVCYDNNMNHHHHHHHPEDGTLLVQEIMFSEHLPCDHHSNWQEMSYNNHYHQQVHDEQHMQQAEILQNGQNTDFSTAFPDSTPYPPTPDHLLNMFPLPTNPSFSLLPNSSISFSNPHQKSSSFLSSLGLVGNLPTSDTTLLSPAVYDSILPLNLPPQPPLLKELFQSLPHGYSLCGSRNTSLFGGVDERGIDGCLYQDGDERQFDNGVFEFAADIAKTNDGKDGKHQTTEKQRRVQMGDKFQLLRQLIPKPSKGDRASIVADAIDYIEELKRRVTELKFLVEKRKCNRERMKRRKTEEGAKTGEEKPTTDTLEQPYGGLSFRSSWLQRKSKFTEVDVRIIDDEVTVKLVQQKRISCLLFASRVLDELQLDLHHVAGGLIGDYYSFLFNSKICEGSNVYASAIANRLIEVVDKQYATLAPSTSY